MLHFTLVIIIIYFLLLPKDFCLVSHITHDKVKIPWGQELVELASLCRKYTWNKWRVNVTKYIQFFIPCLKHFLLFSGKWITTVHGRYKYFLPQHHPKQKVAIFYSWHHLILLQQNHNPFSIYFEFGKKMLSFVFQVTEWV